MKRETKTMTHSSIIIKTKRLQGKGKGRITRVELDPRYPEKVWECFSKEKEFTREYEWDIPITHLLDTKVCMLLTKRDADKVKKLTGKTYEFVRKAEWEKTLAKRAKTQSENKRKAHKRKQDSIEYWSKEPEERDEAERFFLLPEHLLDPAEIQKARDARKRDQEFEKALAKAEKRKADSTIIKTEPQGKHREYQLKTASGVVICTHRTANPEYLEDYEEEAPMSEPENAPQPPAPQAAKTPTQRVILPYTDEEIPVPPNLQIAPMLTLIREHRGHTHRVTVTHDCQFLYEGTVYRTLTEISWKAANYQISGNAFFGLPSKKRSQPSQ